MILILLFQSMSAETCLCVCVWVCLCIAVIDCVSVRVIKRKLSSQRSQLLAEQLLNFVQILHLAVLKWHNEDRFQVDLCRCFHMMV